MNHIAMPASLLNRSSLMISFRSSKKRHLIITGNRGSGKTTLLNSFACADIRTWAEKGKGVYLCDSYTGRSARIGIFSPESTSTENRMRICREGFLETGIPAVKHCMNHEHEFAVIDEIGYLETQCEEYCQTLQQLFDTKRVIAVVRKQEDPFLDSLIKREDAFVIDLDQPFGNTGLVIMASGEGKRFGGNKLMADFKGQPMITHILKASEQIFAKRIVVTRHESVAQICHAQNVDVILHELPYRNDTIRLGLQEMTDTDACAFCPGDQPLLSAETLQALVLASAARKENCFRLKHGETVGAPNIFPKKLYGELLSLPQGKGGNEIIKKHPGILKYISIRDEHELMDIDTREDIVRLQEYGC
ncbi:MAG: NTP transferase domain-containing protein [Oscillospiraceae bacterium]|nr:NTP transferase domain-containing protein [Oscillospiraceae bacterium]